MNEIALTRQDAHVSSVSTSARKVNCLHSEIGLELSNGLSAIDSLVIIWCMIVLRDFNRLLIDAFQLRK